MDSLHLSDVIIWFIYRACVFYLQVFWAEQQVVKSRVKRGYIREDKRTEDRMYRDINLNDPYWEKQWYLVRHQNDVVVFCLYIIIIIYIFLFRVKKKLTNVISVVLKRIRESLQHCTNRNILKYAPPFQ